MNVFLLKDTLTVDFFLKRSDSVASRWNRIIGSKVIMITDVITSWCWAKDNINYLKSKEFLSQKPAG